MAIMSLPVTEIRKNYDTNWITSGYSLWFIREAKYLNNPRMMLKTSCAVSGTGFLVNSSIIKKNNGWKFNLLTEDIQFSVVNILEGEKNRLLRKRHVLR